MHKLYPFTFLYFYNLLASGLPAKSFFAGTLCVLFFILPAPSRSLPLPGHLKNKVHSTTVDTLPRPYVVSANPENNSVNVDENTSISTHILVLPNGGIENATITSTSVFLVEAATGMLVPSNTNGTGGGDAIILVPDSSLKLNTTYILFITDSVQDLAGAYFIPFSDTFSTATTSANVKTNLKFDKIALPNTVGQHTSLTVGPDGKLYALAVDGIIKRFIINPDGTLKGPELLYSLQDAYGSRKKRLAIGLAFDPSSTPGNLIAWITHSTYLFNDGPDWDGKLTKLSGDKLQNVKDVLINLPRSMKDHLTNSIVFGPDGALYFTEGSNSAMGSADKTWSNREEHLLSGALLRLDLTRLTRLPLDVKTPDGGGTYNPYLPGAPLTIYASGLRNTYDLVWHSNGNLYAPTNGSSAGGNTPRSVTGTVRPDGSLYQGPTVRALTNVPQTLRDYLFRIEKGGYYGHPNPLRGEYVLNGGNPTAAADSAQVNAYPRGTLPDRNWRGYSFDFKNDKSPDGAIEYKSNTFNGSLKGKLMVVRYSEDKDIIVLTPGGPNNDIISSMDGTSIPGFSGFADPLDLTEDPANGNIYVAEFGRKGKISLVRPKENIPGLGSISLNPAGVYDNYVSLGDTGTSRLVTIRNTGSGNLIIRSINISGYNASEFMIPDLPGFPILIRAGSTFVFKLIFTPSNAGSRSAFINIKSDDAAKPLVSVPLAGFGIVHLSIFPNPVHKKFTVTFPADYSGNMLMQIMDVSGRTYNTESRTLRTGEFTTDLDISKLSLSAGVYLLKVSSSTGKMQAVKFLVQ